MPNAIGFNINNIIVALKDTVARAMGLPSGGSAGQILEKKSATDYDAQWVDKPTSIGFPTSGTPAALGTASNGSASTAARSDHVHPKPTYGNITTDGAITSDTTAASGDKLILSDSSNSSKLMRSGISFDASTINKALTPKGTWEIFGKVFYGTCSTSAATAAKTASITGFTSSDLVAGTMVVIKFTYTNTNSAPTLNITSTGAKTIKQYGTTAPGSSADINGWYAGAVVPFIYDGTYWVRLFVPVTGGIQVRPDYTYSTTDLTDGSSSLTTGKLYFYYE